MPEYDPEQDLPLMELPDIYALVQRRDWFKRPTEFEKDYRLLTAIQNEIKMQFVNRVPSGRSSSQSL